MWGAHGRRARTEARALDALGRRLAAGRAARKACDRATPRAATPIRPSFAALIIYSIFTHTNYPNFTPAGWRRNAYLPQGQGVRSLQQTAAAVR